MPQNHDIGARKRAHAEHQKRRTTISTETLANNLVARRLANRVILDGPVPTKFDVKAGRGRDLKEGRRRV